MESRNPVTVAAVAGVRSVSAVEGRACAVTEEGALWCWGVDGQRGRRDQAPPIAAPTRVETVGPVRALALGTQHACAYTRAGTLCCWGSNFYGQLGDNTTLSPDRDNAPVSVTW